MAEEGAKKRSFRKYSYRGVDLDQLLDMKTDALVELFHARARRRFSRGLNRKCHTLIKKLRKVGGLSSIQQQSCTQHTVTAAALNESNTCQKHTQQAKKEAGGERPETVRTHLRNMIILPEMIGSVVGVYNGKSFNQVEIRPDMVGHYLAEFSISYKPVMHGRPGIGATHSSRFIPLH